MHFMMFGLAKSLSRMFLKLPGKCSRFLPLASRTFHSQQILRGNYEGDGKTTMSVLNKDNKEIIMFDSISDFGFRLNNGMFVVGPVAVFPRSVLQWNVGSYHDIDTKTLSLFHLLEPKLDLLIIGTGDKSQKLSDEVVQLFRSKRISLEILATEHACSTFNFLNVERRCIAAAFIPPRKIFLSYEEFQLIEDNPRLESFTFEIDSGRPKLPNK